MREIIKVMLQEGIDEETIHECLDIIEENYEAVYERNDRELLNRAIAKTVKQEQEWNKTNPYVKKENRSTVVAKSRLLDRTARRGALAGRKQWKNAGSDDAKTDKEISQLSDKVRAQNIQTYNDNLSSQKAQDVVKKKEATKTQPNFTDAQNIALDNLKSSPRIRRIQGK